MMQTGPGQLSAEYRYAPPTEADARRRMETIHEEMSVGNFPTDDDCNFIARHYTTSSGQQATVEAA